MHVAHEVERQEFTALHFRHVRLDLAREVVAERVAQHALGVVQFEFHGTPRQM